MIHKKRAKTLPSGMHACRSHTVKQLNFRPGYAGQNIFIG